MRGCGSHLINSYNNPFFPEINEHTSRKTVYYPICLYYSVNVFLHLQVHILVSETSSSNIIEFNDSILILIIYNKNGL